jgi:hypothetical protein
MTRALNRRWSSLTVTGIRSSGPVQRVLVAAAARKAWARIARVVHRCQERQRRFWCWYRAVLAVERFFDLPAASGHGHERGEGTGWGDQQ